MSTSTSAHPTASPATPHAGPTAGPPGRTPRARQVRRPARRPVRRRALRRVGVRVALGDLAAAALWLAGALPASAHVHVEADHPTAGGSSQLTFTVPTESENAGTTEVSVTLPQDHPFLYVSARPVAGWDVSVNEATLPSPVDVGGTTLTKAVRTVTWTASEGQQVGPGEYQQFAIMVSPLPAAGTTLSFPATQTYSDGRVVRWNQPTPASGEEPEYPAPTVAVGAATAGGDDHGAGSTSGPATGAASPGSSEGSSGHGSTGASTGTQPTTAAAGTSGAGLTLGATGAGLGLVGAVLGGIALARTRARG
ncbi:uncharacterized protein YcnI [Friedmanniella endophytica]|uniref:Uncharacterized protein YcnI n=1 Tax=Microlunatus kandeliicorticis TaxID=1759536 RepID=A0A7W3IQF6_9ACTN|nr:YcnI family protein [Microlunatus kandeliicorticis]MBA8793342.1 uncharacterized protein YcnI [Microlunatus kandeliicorticis]